MTDTIQVEKKWFIYVKDHHEGPFSVMEILEGVRAGRFAEPAFVWHQQLPDWLDINEIPEFQAAMRGGGAAETAKPPEFTKSGVSKVTTNVEVESETNNDDDFRKEDYGTDDFGSVEEEAESREPGFSEHSYTQPSYGEGGFDDPAAGSGKTKSDLIVEIRPLQGKGKGEPAPVSVEESERSRIVQPEYVSAGREEIGDITLTSDYTNGGSLRKPKRQWLTKKQMQLVGAILSFSVLLAILIGNATTREKMNGMFSGMSPFPHLTDVTPSDYEALKKTSRTPVAQGALVEVAVSTADPISPSFYVASNLSEGAKFEVHVIGVPESLMNTLKFEGKLVAQTEKGLGKTSALRYPDGKVIPRGEYRVFVVEAANGQPAEISAQLNQIAATPKTAPFPVPSDRKVFFEKKIFWGERDQTYLSRLKDFHDKLNAKSLEEIGEIREMVSLIETQIQKSEADFDRLKVQALGSKQVQAWVGASQTWNQFATQVTSALDKVSANGETLEHVHLGLYQHLKRLNSDVLKLRELQGSYFSQKVPIAQISPVEVPLRANLEKNLLELKSAIALLEASPKNPQGLPNEVPVKYVDTEGTSSTDPKTDPKEEAPEEIPEAKTPVVPAPAPAPAKVIPVPVAPPPAVIPAPVPAPIPAPVPAPAPVPIPVPVRPAPRPVPAPAPVPAARPRPVPVAPPTLNARKNAIDRLKNLEKAERDEEEVPVKKTPITPSAPVPTTVRPKAVPPVSNLPTRNTPRTEGVTPIVPSAPPTPAPRVPAPAPVPPPAARVLPRAPAPAVPAAKPKAPPPAPLPIEEENP